MPESHLRLDQISAALVACAQPLVALGWRNVPEGTELAPGDADAAADLLSLALGFYKVEKFRALKEAKFRPFDEVDAEMREKLGVGPFTLVKPPASPVSVGEDLREPIDAGPILQRVTDLRPLEAMQEALGDAVQSLDDALAEVAAKGPEEELPS